MPHPLFVMNGSNLNMLGMREPALYGSTTLDEIERRTRRLAQSLDLDCDFRQTNHEGVMVDWIQEAAKLDAAVVINPVGRIRTTDMDGGASRQKELLQAEGVVVADDLRVDLRVYLWEGLHLIELDDIIAGRG